MLEFNQLLGSLKLLNVFANNQAVLNMPTETREELYKYLNTYGIEK